MLSPGARLGGYEMLGPLGAGGMGEVHRARDLRLGREVALKLLPSRLADDPDALARLEREARALASLHHPHVATLFGFEESGETRFLVMELVEGETLAERISRGPLPVPEVLALFGQIAEGLEAAHEKGIVHRDLKPANLMITPGGRAKILDFGLAKVVGGPPGPLETSSPTEADAGTRAGAVMGTAAYMSPEQARGLPVDRRTDVWSFGACLYEALTGRRPFPGPTMADLIAQVLEREPDWTALPDELPEEAAALLRRCLRKERVERPQGVREVGQRLQERSLGSAPTLRGAPGPAPSPLRRPWMTAAACLGIVVGVTLGVWIARSHRPIESVAVLPFVNATGSPDLDYVGDGIPEELINQLTQVPALRVIARPTAFTYRGKEISPRVVGAELKVRAVVTGRVALRGDLVSIQVDVVDVHDGSQFWGGRFERPRADLVLLQTEIVPRVTETLRLRLTPAQSERMARKPTADAEAYKAYLRGRIALSDLDSEEGFQQAVSFFQESVRRDPRFAPGWAGLGVAHAYLASADVDEPTRAIVPARAAVSRALELDPDLAEGHTALGIIRLAFDWDLPGAEAEIRKAIALSPGDIFGVHWLAHYLEAAGRYAEAEPILRHAAALDPLTPLYQGDLVFHHYQAGAPRKALDLVAGLGSDPKTRDHAGIIVSTVLCQEQLGNRAAALSAVDKVSTDCAECLGGGVRGFLLARLGREAEARKLLSDLEARARERYVSPVGIAAIAAGLGEKERALAALEKAVELRSPTLVYVLRFPFFASLRSEPRFRAVWNKVYATLPDKRVPSFAS